MKSQAASIIRKLSSQDPLRIGRRLAYGARRTLIDVVFPTTWINTHTVFRPDMDDILYRDYFCGRTVPEWHWNVNDVPAIVASLSDTQRTHIIDEADRLCSRRFTFRGRPEVMLEAGVWRPKGVSIGWVWDLNRHFWFSILGFAFCCTGDSRFVRSFIEESADSIARRLPALAKNGLDSPFEVAARINAWIWAHFLFLGTTEWDNDHHERFLHAIALQAEYLYHTIEYHSLGNHLLLEAKTLALCGEVFRIAGSYRWRDKGWRILRREIALQVCPNGVHGERSTMYHRIVAGELAELYHFCKRNLKPQASLLEVVVRRMACFLQWLDSGYGALPLFGNAYVQDTYFRFWAPTLLGETGTWGSGKDDGRLIDCSSWVSRGQNAALLEHPDALTPAARAFPAGATS